MLAAAVRLPAARAHCLLGAGTDVERARPRIARLADRGGAGDGVPRTPPARSLAGAAQDASAPWSTAARGTPPGAPPTSCNQINWNAQLYAAAARVTGHHDLLRGGYRRLLGALRGGDHAASGAFNPSSKPGGRATASTTARSAASAAGSTSTPPSTPTSSLSSLRYYASARHGGHGAAVAPRVVRSDAGTGSTRGLAGSWTHAGYLNWDTGYGWHRWHSGQYWAFAQQGLLAVARRAALLGAAGVRALDQSRSSTTACCCTSAGHARPAARSPRRTRSTCARSIAPRPLRVPASRPTPCARSCSDSDRGARRSRPRCTRRASRPVASGCPHRATRPRSCRDNRGAFAYGGIDLARLLRAGAAGRGEHRRRVAERVRRRRPRRAPATRCWRRSTGAGAPGTCG